MDNKIGGAVKVNGVCMLSIHGYFQAHPELGRIDTGGQVVYVLEIAKYMAKKDAKVDIYTRKFGNRKTIEKVAKGVRIIRIPCGGNKFIHKERLFEYLPEYVDNMTAFMNKRNLEYDIINSHYWDAGWVAMKLSEKLGVPFVDTAHSLGVWKKERMKGDGELMEKRYRFGLRIANERKIYKRSKSIIATTPMHIEKYVNYYGVDEAKIKLVPPGVDSKRFFVRKKKDYTKKLGLPKNFVFTAGRVTHSKGHDLLIRSFAKVARQISDMYLVMDIGSTHMTKRGEKQLLKLQQLTERLDIDDRVIFITKYIPDKLLPLYYTAARVCAISSRYEPFGMTCIEAMACGTPTIITSRGGFKDMVEDGTQALVANPSSPRQYANAIIKIIKDKDLAEKLSVNGASLVSREFTWDVLTEKTLNIFNEGIT